MGAGGGLETKRYEVICKILGNERVVHLGAEFGHICSFLLASHPSSSAVINYPVFSACPDVDRVLGILGRRAICSQLSFHRGYLYVCLM